MGQSDKSVLVVGGGVAGFTVAAALGQRGIKVDLVEIKKENTVLGVGIIQPGNALRALKSIGVLEECLATGFATDTYRYFESDGTPIADLKLLRIADADKPAINTLRRPALNQILTHAAVRAGADVRLGMTVTSLREEKDAVSVTFSDGSTGSYAMVVGADGIRSPVRNMLFGGAHAPQFTGHGVWRYTARRPAELTYQAMYLGVGRKVGLMPLTGEMMYLLLVTNTATDARVPQDELKSRLSAELEGFDGLVPHVRDQLAASDDVIYVPIEEVILAPPWSKGRVVIIGDAAHASGPHIAQGAAMAIEDAVVLAEMFTGAADVRSMLLAFAERRYPRCKFVQDTSRAVGEEGNLDDPAACRARNEKMRKMFAAANQRPHETYLAEPI
jgi:2-polyprenyl-6-methoxyphenol hydroxylase-like FAD-dependent oxidoreductase